MGITEKLANAKSTSWLSEGLSEEEIKTTVQLAKISARIEKYRLDMGMTQKEFADYMGVTQGMVSKWESREYNFTVKSLNEICAKIGLSLNIQMEDKAYKCSDYTVLVWDKEHLVKNLHSGAWHKEWTGREEIA